MEKQKIEMIWNFVSVGAGISLLGFALFVLNLTTKMLPEVANPIDVAIILLIFIMFLLIQNGINVLVDGAKDLLKARKEVKNEAKM
jgi:hypothetical protein